MWLCVLCPCCWVVLHRLSAPLLAVSGQRERTRTHTLTITHKQFLLTMLSSATIYCQALNTAVLVLYKSRYCCSQMASILNPLCSRICLSKCWILRSTIVKCSDCGGYVLVVLFPQGYSYDYPLYNELLVFNNSNLNARRDLASFP